MTAIVYQSGCFPYGALALGSISAHLSGKPSTLEFKEVCRFQEGFYLLNNNKVDDLGLLEQLCQSLPHCEQLGQPEGLASLLKWVGQVGVEFAGRDLDRALEMWSFLGGQRLSLADLAVWGRVRPLQDSPHLNTLPHLRRWLKFISNLPGLRDALSAHANQINQANQINHRISAANKSDPTNQANQVNQVNQVNLDTRANQGTKAAQDTAHKYVLKNAVRGQVVTRFAPEPSGYLHIGHAKAALLNHYFARQYEGRLLLRFDDTNPTKEKSEYEETIKEDLKLLGVKFDGVSHSSDYFERLQQVAISFIERGLAYCDDTEVEVMRQERTDGVESRCRGQSKEESLRIFAEMVKGTPQGTTYCLRARLSPAHPNKCLRDPVIYRCIPTAHHRVGDKFKAFPTYDFACPIIDSLEGITHALRSNEYSSRIPQYKWFLQAAGFNDLEIFEFSRMNFVRTLLSKRKLQWFVSNGLVRGWDDPRMPTIRGIARRGLRMDALMEFILEQGPSRAVNLMEWDKLWARNRQVVDWEAPRFWAVEGAVAVRVEGWDGTEWGERPLHPKNKELGTCPLRFGDLLLIEEADASEMVQGEEITLMKWGNCVITAIESGSGNDLVSGNDLNSGTESIGQDLGLPGKDSVGNESAGKESAGTESVLAGLEKSGVRVSRLALRGRLHLEGDFKKTKRKVHWLALRGELLPCTLLEFDHLLAVDKVEEGSVACDEDLRKLLNPSTERVSRCLAEANMAKLAKGDVLQLERKGFFIVDRPYGPGQEMVLIRVPDGKRASQRAANPK